MNTNFLSFANLQKPFYNITIIYNITKYKHEPLVFQILNKKEEIKNKDRL